MDTSKNFWLDALRPEENYLDCEGLFAPLEEITVPLLAVSGGSDSLALLFLVAHWAHSRSKLFQVASVNHGLRTESTTEVDYVARLCYQLGIAHTILGWYGEKPVRSIANSARKARYGLLASHGARIGTSAIITAHTYDDQLETVLMRSQRGVPPQTGISGMGECTHYLENSEYTRFQIFRPLLGVWRWQLRTYLNKIGVGWCDDPTNQDQRYERIRMRQWLKNAPASTINHIGRISRLGGRYRTCFARDTAVILRLRASLSPRDVWMLDLKDIQTIPNQILIHAVRILVAAAGGGEYLVSRCRIQKKLDKELSTFDLPGKKRWSLGKCVMEMDNNQLHIWRENRGLGAIQIAGHEGNGKPVVWDNRFIVSNHSGKRIHIAACAEHMIAIRQHSLDHKKKASPLFVDSNPVILTWDNRVILPLQEPEQLRKSGLTLRRTAPALEDFCPNFDDLLYQWYHTFTDPLS